MFKSHLALMLILIMSCKPNTHKDQVGDPLNPHSYRGFLTNDEVSEPFTPTPLNMGEMRKELNSQSVFFNRYPTDNSTAESCFSRAINQQKIKASQTSIVIDVEGQVQNCKENEYTTVQSAEYKLLQVIYCAGGDLSSFHGKSISDVTTNDIRNQCQPGKGLILGNSRIKGNFAFAQANNRFNYTAHTTGSIMAIDHSACEFEIRNNNIFWNDGCTETQLSKTTRPDKTIQDFFRARFNGVSSIMTNRNIERGRMNVIVNDWQGQVEFDGNKNLPRYLIRNTNNSNQTDSGQITGYLINPVNSSLGLR